MQYEKNLQGFIGKGESSTRSEDRRTHFRNGKQISIQLDNWRFLLLELSFKGWNTMTLAQANLNYSPWICKILKPFYNGTMQYFKTQMFHRHAPSLQSLFCQDIKINSMTIKQKGYFSAKLFRIQTAIILRGCYI